VVRKALQNFLGEFIPMLHARDIHPFLPLLIVYTCSAMTHILDDIREDALKFMDLWVAAGGQVVVNGFWDKVLVISCEHVAVFCMDDPFLRNCDK
jgi:hypothetical protein